MMIIDDDDRWQWWQWFWWALLKDLDDKISEGDSQVSVKTIKVFAPICIWCFHSQVLDKWCWCWQLDFLQNPEFGADDDDDNDDDDMLPSKYTSWDVNKGKGGSISSIDDYDDGDGGCDEIGDDYRISKSLHLMPSSSCPSHPQGCTWFWGCFQILLNWHFC